MKTLLVFDIAFDKRHTEKLNLNVKDEIFVFPLTSSISKIEEVLNIARAYARSIKIISTGELINQAADKLRKRFINFIGTMPEQIKAGGRNLRDYFKVDNIASLWWFSLVAEKNVYKTDSFNCLAQLDSIIRVIRDERIDKVVIGSANNKIVKALTVFTKKDSIRLQIIPIRNDEGIAQRFKRFQTCFYFKHTILLCLNSIKVFVEFVCIKMMLGKKNTKVPVKCRQMIVTYFPNIDTNLAARGVFKNRYYPYLQDVLERKDQDLVWIAMYVQANSVSFRESIEYAKKFIKKGNKIYFLEEFGNVRMLFASFICMIKMSLRFLRLQKQIQQIHNLDGYNFYALFKDDWFSSFCGTTGYWGLLYYKRFGKMLQKINPEKCLYYCEMHAWENALILAKNKVLPDAKLFAYQHSTISRMRYCL